MELKGTSIMDEELTYEEWKLEYGTEMSRQHLYDIYLGNRALTKRVIEVERLVKELNDAAEQRFKDEDY